MRSAFFVTGFQIATFEMWMGSSLLTIPPGWFFIGFGFWCFFTWFTPATSRKSTPIVRVTSPRLPLSRPARTTTLSPFFILRMTLSLQHFRRERHDLHEPLGAQFPGHRSEDAGADRLQLRREEHRRVGVELHLGAVVAAHALPRPHDDRVVDLALLHAAARRRILDADLDHVADMRVPAFASAEHLDTHHPPGAGVVGDIQHRLH